MTKTELEQWHDLEYWPIYLKFVKTPFATKWGAGGKGESQTKMLQINPSKELRDRIIMSLTAQMRHRRVLYDKLGSAKAYDDHTSELAKGGEAVYKNRQSRTYLHNKGWNDEIPPITEEQKTSDTTYCQTCNKREVHGPKFSECSECLTDDKYLEDCRKYMRDNGLTKGKDEPVPDYYQRCREHALKLGVI